MIAASGVLGPIDLNLLGLRVATNEIRVLIEAIPGAGNLLGNLWSGEGEPQPERPMGPLAPGELASLAVAGQRKADGA